MRDLIEKQKEEFDNNQRRFLGGLLHSTQFNKWYIESIAQILTTLIEEEEKVKGITLTLPDGQVTDELVYKDQTINRLKEIISNLK